MAASFEVLPLEALSDNFMYLISCPTTKCAAVVDPVEPEKLLSAAADRGLRITVALTTHHHFDHAGGNKELKRLLPEVEVVGGEPNVEGMTRLVTDGETILLGNLAVRCIHTPAHTAGHMSYLVSSAGDGAASSAVFTGDVLFVGGCGRFFEGTPEQMVQSAAKLGALDGETLLYCGHEYTVKNLQFGLVVEPDNEATQRKIVWAQDMRAAGRPTVPSTIADEKAFNPFMRYREPTVRAYVDGRGGGSGQVGGDEDVMRRLRNLKDGFAGSSRPWIPGGGPLPGL